MGRHRRPRGGAAPARVRRAPERVATGRERLADPLFASVPDDLREDLAEILDESDRARLAALRAGGTPNDADITRVTAMLSHQPRLVEWLNAHERMMRLREQAVRDARASELGLDPWAYAASREADDLASDNPFRRLAAEDARTQRGYGAAGSRTIDAESLRIWSSPTGRVTGDGARYDPGQVNDKYGWRNVPDEVQGSFRLRLYAEQDEWVRAAINMRRTQVGRAVLACVPINPLKSYNKTLMKEIQRLLDQPNEARQNRRELLESVVEDILVLDRGCISKNMDAARRPHALYAEDGATIRVYPGWSGKPNEPRYLYVDPSTDRKVPLRNDQLICMVDNPGTYRTGLSPVQILLETIEADRQATRSAIHMVKMKPPPLMVQLPGAQRNQIEAIRDYYDNQVAGRKETFFLGGDAAMNVEKLVFSAKDNQWMEWQEYLCRKIAVIFKMPASYFGGGPQATPGDAQVNRDLFEDTGLLPLMMLIEEYLNAELLADYAPKLGDWRVDTSSLNLKIVFPQVGELQRQMHAEKAAEIAATGLVQLPSFTLNQILAMRGEQPVPGGNTFYVNTSIGPVPWLSYDGNVDNYNPLQAMAGMSDSGDPNLNVGDNGQESPVRTEPEQPGKPVGQSNDHATPPEKPTTAPTPRQTAANAMAAATRTSGLSGLSGTSGDVARKLFDFRAPGSAWSPESQALAEALDALEIDEQMEQTDE